MFKRVVRFYHRHIRKRLPPMFHQRLKLLVLGWAYLPVLFWDWMPRRASLLLAFIRIDWHIQHVHRPAEIVAIARAFHHLPPGDMVEAGCWNGGSTAKFSLLCQRFGRKLWVYDSFQGVMEHARASWKYNYAGEYAAPEALVRQNVARFGVPAGVSFVAGWFSDTLTVTPPPAIAIAYIDCDVAEGTRDALIGITQTLTSGGAVFTQDYHIPTVRKLLDDPALWQSLTVDPPRITPEAHHTARLEWATPSRLP